MLYRNSSKDGNNYPLTKKEIYLFNESHQNVDKTIITKIEGKPVMAKWLGQLNGDLVFNYD